MIISSSRIIFFCFLVFHFFSCTPLADELKWEPKEDVMISKSARGWNVKPGPPKPGGWSVPTTVIINPQGAEYNIGYTQYPDYGRSNLFLVELKEMNSKFLMLCTPPVASGGTGMPILFV